MPNLFIEGAESTYCNVPGGPQPRHISNIHIGVCSIFISAVGNLSIVAHSNVMVREFQNTVTRCRAFLIIVKMRNVINIGVKIVFATTPFSQTGRVPHKIGSWGHMRPQGRSLGSPDLDCDPICIVYYLLCSAPQFLCFTCLFVLL